MAYPVASDSLNVLKSPGRVGPLRDMTSKLAQLWLVRWPGAVAPWTPFVSDALGDGAWTSPWRALAALTPFVALAVGFLGSFHRIGLDQIYSNSLLFMVIVVASAIVSGPAGLMLLIGYAGGDVLSGGGALGRQFAISSPFGVIQTALRETGSQTLGYLLLAIPSIGVPRLATSLARSLPLRLPSDKLASVRARIVFFPIGCAFLVFLWCQGMTVLIRPIFTWRNTPVTALAVQTFRSEWGWLVLTAFLAAVGRVLLEEAVQRWAPWRTTVARVRRSRQTAQVNRESRWRKLPLPIQIAVPAGLTTLILSGLYGGWSDAVAVGFVATILSTWRVGLGGRLPAGLGQKILHAPPLLRFGAALLVAYIGYELVRLFFPSIGAASPTRPLLAGGLLSLIASHVLFPGRPPGQLGTRAKFLRLPNFPL